ncbi:MAG: hypothetical protein Q4D81_12270 [Eubacteriales bacterium]|nr:hypothetical protein [Eubacteriales bacterium]
MPFCGKCGKVLNDGEICDCDKKGSTTGAGESGGKYARMHEPEFTRAGGMMDGPAPGGAGSPYGDGTGRTPSGGAGSPYGDGTGGGAYGSGAGRTPSGGAGSPYGDGAGRTPSGGAGSPYGGTAGPSGAAAAAEVVETLSPYLADFLSALSAFWVRFKNRVGLGEPETNDVDYYERDLLIVPQCIEPDSGEVPIKQYKMAVLRSRLILSRAEGRLQVTNKRVIFRATGRSLMGRTTLQHEFAIDEIAGIKLRKNYRFSFLNYLGISIVVALGSMFGGFLVHQLQAWHFPVFIIQLLSLLVTGICAIPFFTMYKKFPLKMFFAAIGYGMIASVFSITRYNTGFGQRLWMIPLILVSALLLFMMWIVCWVPNLVATVDTKGTQPAVEIRRKEAGLFNLFRKPEYTGFGEVLPWKDTELAIIELWAMISDIQKYGDEAIKMWK